MVTPAKYTINLPLTKEIENQFPLKPDSLVSTPPPAPLWQSSDVGQEFECSQQEGLIYVNEDTLVRKEFSVK